MSFLMEVLQSAEKVELDEINTKVPEVKIAVDAVKKDVSTFLENVYVKFMERPKRNRILARKSNELQEEAENVKNRVEQIQNKSLLNAGEEVARHLTALNQVNIALSLIHTSLKLHEALNTIKKLSEINSYSACMQKIKETENCINSITETDCPQVWQEMRVTVLTEKSSLLYKMSNVFSDYVILKPGEKYTTVKVLNNKDALNEVLSALYLYKTSVTPLDNVTKFVWDCIFVPVVDFVAEIKTTSSDDSSLLEIIVVDTKAKPPYTDVFKNIKNVLEFLINNFNINLSEDLTTLDYIGQDIRDNLSELLIKRCLQDTIPTTAEGLQRYAKVIEDTEDLERSLVESGIFGPDTTSILDYANNVDFHFINKKCQDYLVQAQNLMKKDLHDMVEVGTPEDANSLKLTLEFPKCSVSKSVMELLGLVETILAQALASSDICAGRLFCTAKNIFQKYSSFVPQYHKKLLQTIPQQVALFYNNCGYIAYKLTEFNEKYLKKLPSLLSVGPNGFADEGSQLQNIASNMFTAFTESQIKQIEEIMKDSGLQQHQTLDKVEAAVEKTLRQCLRQQELLKTVWSKVLPYSVYNKTLGAILNALCTYLIDSIVKFEDISSDAAEQLLDVYKMVLVRGPKLFTDPKEVSLFVKNWYKLNEVVFVLNASLLDINDRWADGKGPLALQLKPVEMKQLVRALFQNTERRAALLSKIHD